MLVQINGFYINFGINTVVSPDEFYQQESHDELKTFNKEFILKIDN